MFKSNELIVTTCAFCRHIQFTNPVVLADTHKAFLSDEELAKLENLRYFNYKMKCKHCGAKAIINEEWNNHIN
jgi:hypothetical protein